MSAKYILLNLVFFTLTFVTIAEPSEDTKIPFFSEESKAPLYFGEYHELELEEIRKSEQNLTRVGITASILGLLSVSVSSKKGYDQSLGWILVTSGISTATIPHAVRRALDKFSGLSDEECYELIQENMIAQATIVHNRPKVTKSLAIVHAINAFQIKETPVKKAEIFTEYFFKLLEHIDEATDSDESVTIMGEDFFEEKYDTLKNRKLFSNIATIFMH